MTLGNAAAARVRLIVWCKGCQYQVEPDPAKMAAQYGAETPVLDWHERVGCSKWGSRQVDMVMTGTQAATRLTAGKLMLAAPSPRILAPLEPAEARGIRSQTQATPGSPPFIDRARRSR